MNMIAAIGHNNPPEVTPFDLSQTEINDLFDEAKLWMDGKPISTQDEADAIATLMRRIQEAAKTADARRVDENKPFDEGKAAVQAKYAPLIADTKAVKGKSVMAVEACKKALSPWLAKLEAERLAKAEAARKEAAEKAEVARLAMQQRDSLEAAAHAEALVLEARKAEADARKIETSKSHAKGEGRAIGLRDYYTPEVTDGLVFARFVWADHRPALLEWLEGFAKHLVDSGKRDGIPGVTVKHERKAV